MVIPFALYAQFVRVNELRVDGRASNWSRKRGAKGVELPVFNALIEREIAHDIVGDVIGDRRAIRHHVPAVTGARTTRHRGARKRRRDTSRLSAYRGNGRREIDATGKHAFVACVTRPNG